MREMRKFVREELSGWEKWEVAWLLAACTVIAVLSIDPAEAQAEGDGGGQRKQQTAVRGY